MFSSTGKFSGTQQDLAVSKVSKSTTNEMVYGELGRCPLILEKKGTHSEIMAKNCTQRINSIGSENV